MLWVLVLLYVCFLGFCVFLFGFVGFNICISGSVILCEECLLIYLKCVWCFKEDFGSLWFIIFWCDLRVNFVRNGCGGEIESLVSSFYILRSLFFSSKGLGFVGWDVI